MDNISPLATVKSFLACISTKSADKMRNLAHADATVCRIRNNQPSYVQLAQVIAHMKTVQDYMEETTYDEVEHIDGSFASVWTPYRFYQDGKVGIPTSPYLSAVKRSD